MDLGHPTSRWKVRRNMIQAKSCPRCVGDMYREELLGEAEMVCLQCGHRTYPEEQRKWPVAQTRIERKAA